MSDMLPPTVLEIIGSVVRKFDITPDPVWRIGEKVTMKSRTKAPGRLTGYFLAPLDGLDDPRPLAIAVCDALGLPYRTIRAWRPRVRDTRALVLLGTGQLSPVSANTLCVAQRPKPIATIDEIVREYRVRTRVEGVCYPDALVWH